MAKKKITKENFPCDDCGKVFEWKRILDTHKMIHDSNKPKPKLQDGKEMQNDVIIPKIKIECTKSSNNKNILNLNDTSLEKQLIIHKRSHTGEKLFKCDVCQKNYASKASLYLHKKNLHTNKKIYKCTQCTKHFKTYPQLYRHKKSHEAKTFKCEFCSKEMASKYNLSNHIKLHSGEKLFKCTLCIKQFVTKDSLIVHTRWHNNEKPFKCQISVSISDSLPGNRSQIANVLTLLTIHDAALLGESSKCNFTILCHLLL